MLTSESSVNRSTHVIKRSSDWIGLDLITPVEAERINGFDDNWTKHRKNASRNLDISVWVMPYVVPMVTRMGKVLNKIFENEK